jgi:hypothetical protein
MFVDREKYLLTKPWVKIPKYLYFMTPFFPYVAFCIFIRLKRTSSVIKKSRNQTSLSLSQVANSKYSKMTSNMSFQVREMLNKQKRREFYNEESKSYSDSMSEHRLGVEDLSSSKDSQLRSNSNHNS